MALSAAPPSTRKPRRDGRRGSGGTAEGGILGRFSRHRRERQPLPKKVAIAHEDRRESDIPDPDRVAGSDEFAGEDDGVLGVVGAEEDHATTSNLPPLTA